jgi:hypothetical protein
MVSGGSYGGIELIAAYAITTPGAACGGCY